MKKDMVLMGEYLGTIEEFVPGKGTFAEKGKIYASIVGEAVLDKMNHAASVEGKVVPDLEVDQTVFGEVINIRKSNVTVIIKKMLGQQMQLDEKASLYVSNIADGYVEKPDDVFGVGDIVKAKIIRISGGQISLGTKGDSGVVLAFCKRCRHPLKKTEKYKDKLVCPNCAHEESRKIASDYGDVRDL